MNAETKRLGDLVTVKGGKRLPAGVELVTENTGHPYIRGRDIRNGRITFEDPVYVPREAYPQIQRYTVKTGDVCITIVGNIGDVGITPPELSGANLTENAVKLVEVSADLDSAYLAYALLSPAAQAQMKLSAAGAAQPKLGIYKVNDIEIPVAPIRVQRHIASILSAYDDLIENNTRRVAILEEIARRTYEEWFVHFRFPGHEQVRMVESEAGFLPEGWKLKRLAEVAAVNELSIRSATAPDEILYVDIASVTPGAITQKGRYAFSEAPGRARRVVRHGDVLWSCVRPNRRSYALALQPEPNLIASTGFAVITAKSIPFSYLYLATTTDDFVSYLTNHATGAAYPAVTASTFEGSSIITPSTEVLDQFSAITTPMLELCNTLMRKNANLQTARDLLLPRLISGELPASALTDSEEAVPV